MSRMFLKLGGYEASILWRFFDGVSSAVSMRLVRGSPLKEENLTFLLCELLDADTTFLHALSYPLLQAKADLEASDAGLTLDVEFETHEHERHVESEFSGADLGIVLAVNHPLLGHSRRGILMQAKRLFRRNGEYSLNSDYRSFDHKQAKFLDALRKGFGVDNSVYYLWYNPPSTAFPDFEAKLFRAYEANGCNQRMHPILNDLIALGPFASGGRVAPAGDDAGARQWRQTQPALRISELDAVLSVTTGTPRLKTFCDPALDYGIWPTFSPFADFLLFALASPRYGSENVDWIHLVEGQRISMPPLKRTAFGEEAAERLQSVPAPRHTLRLTLRSTLPEDQTDFVQNG